MENLPYSAVVPTLFQAVPEAKDAYDAWDMPGEPLPHIVLSFLEESLFTPAVVSGTNPELLSRIFDFLERMALSPNEEVVTLLWIGLFEPWAASPHTFGRAVKYMKPATKELAYRAALQIAGLDLPSMS